MNQSHFPFGMDPTEEDIEGAVVQGRKIYEGCPETICNHRAECCQAGMPNLYFSEFLSLRRGRIDKMSQEERADLTIECLKRYLYNQKKQKPCAFLKDNMCGLYEFRPLKCRLYGLIPDEMYKRNADSVAKENGVPLEQVPLCNQCPFVKVKPEFKEKFPDNVIPEKDIREMENHFRVLDRTLGLSKGFQDQGFGFLTYHDWHLLFEFGPEWMEILTQFRLKWTDEQKEKFIGELKSALEAAFANKKSDSEETKK